MAKPNLNIGLKSYDDIFKADDSRDMDEIRSVPLSELKPFEEQPFKVPRRILKQKTVKNSVLG